MQKVLNWLDEIAQTSQDNKTVLWLERISFFFLSLMILCAPHSIAASQTSWLCGMTAWAIRLLFKPRPKILKTSLNIAFWLFWGWSIVSAVFSYAPDISIDKLRSVSLFFVFFYVINNLRTKRAAVFLIFTLIGSCMVSAAWTPIERLIGRGVVVCGISADSPLAKAGLKQHPETTNYIKDGDTIVKIKKQKIFTPEELVTALEKNDVTYVKMYRPDYDYIIEVKRSDLLPGDTALEKLGVQRWEHSRNWRSAGFYGHYTTYAEVLQLIASLTLGILVVLVRRKSENPKEKKLKFVFGFCLVTLLLALLMTVTRASQTAFLVSAFVIVLLSASRRVLIALAVFTIPLVLIGALFLQESRNVGFFDESDNSITWRQTVYREGIKLATNSPRHLIVGVGMDSIKRYAQEWNLFDNGKLPMGHFHSTPLQLAVERGMPALLLWLWILWIYGSSLWKRIRIEKGKIKPSFDLGIIVGCMGGLVGFFTSGLVHYNLGDGEVAMVFYILMAIGIYLVKSDESQKISTGIFEQHLT